MKLLNRPACRALTVAAALVCLVGLASPEARAQSEKHEREYVDKTARKMPVIIHAVNNLQKAGDEWFRDLEVVVKNKSDKPIYYIDIVLDFPNIPPPPPEARADGTTPSKAVTGFALSFGNPRLGDIKNLATPEDEAIQPGETYVFKMPEARAKGLEHMKKTRGLHANAADLIEIEVNTISYGDGTGYIGDQKIVFPKESNVKGNGGGAPRVVSTAGEYLLRRPRAPGPRPRGLYTGPRSVQ